MKLPRPRSERALFGLRPRGPVPRPSDRDTGGCSPGRRFRKICCAGLYTLVAMAAGPGAAADASARIVVGSKKFTESVILGEILSGLLRSSGVRAEHRRDLGGTRVLWNALHTGDIDAYVEYTGTLRQELLDAGRFVSREEVRQLVESQGLRMSEPLGFNNTYALGMRRELADELGIETVSDLVDHPGLALGFTNEFMDRADGWPGLRRTYAMPHQNVRGLDHDLAYRGLASGDIAVTDLYSTDADIAYYDLRVLRDDRAHFPEYQAVIVYRQDLETRFPDAVRALLRLENQITEERMIAMNASVKLDRRSESTVAARFLESRFAIRTDAPEDGLLARLLAHTLAHLGLVGTSLGFAVLVALPLGVLSAKQAALGNVILAATGILQTIPSLALLVFMIPLLGIGAIPAIVALFLYSLLPIVRNTYTGLREIPDSLIESAEALGLSGRSRLCLIELPLAAPSILAGIKTAAVINVGTATLGALIGAGGYGQPILTGIRLDDVGLILQGAVPAAMLALAVQGGFDLSERLLVPKGLRLGRET